MPSAYFKPAAFYPHPTSIYRRPSALFPKMTALLALNICTQLQTMKGSLFNWTDVFT
jgi:hypothetical protein